jgi:hypothetical protein
MLFDSIPLTIQNPVVGVGVGVGGRLVRVRMRRMLYRI